MRLKLTSKTDLAALHALIGLLLVICYPLQPLYSGNQNIYFLWGMAKAGIGSLPMDPMLAQNDPFPLFSLLVFAVVKFLHPWMFHMLYWSINCIYSYALFGIANQLFTLYTSISRSILFTAFFLLLHTGTIWSGLFQAMFHLDLSWVWDSGIAEQGVLRGYLQPSTAGVFLLLSVFYFVRSRPMGAFLSIAVAALIHANYVILGAGLAAVYVILFVKDQGIEPRKVLFWASICCLAVVPQVVYSYAYFIPHTPEAKELLRIAVLKTQVNNIHLSPILWLNAKTVLQLSTIGAALWLFKDHVIGKLLGYLALLFGLVAIIGLAFESQTILSLTPWRITALMMPLSTAIILGKLLTHKGSTSFNRAIASVFALSAAALLSFGVFRVFGSNDPNFIYLWKTGTLVGMILAVATAWGILKLWNNRHIVTFFGGLCSLGFVCSGLLEIVMQQHFAKLTPHYGVMHYLKTHSTTDDLILVPNELTTIRLNSEVAVVADSNLVHGMQLPELLARQHAVHHYYTHYYSRSQTDSLRTDLKFTAAVIPIAKEIPKDLGASEVFRDENYRVVRW